MNTLSMPPAWQGVLPAATPPPDMAIYQLPTGTYQTRAAFAFTGGSFRDKRSFAATAVLVKHPQGDLLIDAGFGSEIAAHVHAQPWFARAPYQVAGTASEQLDANGYDRSRLRGVLITHSHWDHVSGLDQLDLPIWTNAGELQYAAGARDGKVFRTVSQGHEIHRYEFDSAPYLGFASSFDAHGDGSVVVALAGGHTTGSVIVFVTLPADKRYAFIGDVTWQLEGVRKPAERPLLMRRLADVDPRQVRQDLLRVASLAGLMQVVPAHDVRAYDGIPRLPARSAASPTPALSNGRPAWPATAGPAGQSPGTSQPGERLTRHQPGHHTERGINDDTPTTSLGCFQYDTTRALFDGSVSIAGISATMVTAATWPPRARTDVLCAWAHICLLLQ